MDRSFVCVYMEIGHMDRIPCLYTCVHMCMCAGIDQLFGQESVCIYA